MVRLLTLDKEKDSESWKLKINNMKKSKNDWVATTPSLDDFASNEIKGDLTRNIKNQLI